jgi:fructosamine-3-kinase
MAPEPVEPFVKHRAGAPPGFFAAEARGLRWLAESVPHGGPMVPEVLAVDAERITLTRVAAGPWTARADEAFGRSLAAMHRLGSPRFGAAGSQAVDGFIGPLPQDDTGEDDWPTFYGRRRIQPMLGRALDAGALGNEAVPVFERLVERLAELAGPPEPPARLHGDLWRGNVLADGAGRVWVIDPSAHGGHRETDLAMMRLFGGFGPACEAAYAEAFPLAEGWRDRVALHQLYPLLVHAVLFGGHYGGQALAVARRYGGR